MKTRRDEIRGLEWYARNPEHALDGMADMTPEQRGIYNTILDRIYLTGDRLRDHDQREAAANNCDVRVYRRVKAYLITHGKITLEPVDEIVFIRNQAASNEVAKGIAMVTAKAIAGAEGGRASASKRDNYSSKNNGGRQARAQAPAKASAQHLNLNKNNNLTDRPSSVPAREGSDAHPEGRSSPSAAAEMAESTNAAVRAFWAILDQSEQASWVAYSGTVKAAGKGFIVSAPTPARANLIADRFATKLRASLKAVVIQAPGQVDLTL